MLRVALVIDDYNELIYLQTILRKIGIDVEGLQNVKKYSELSLGFNPQVLIASAYGKKVNGLEFMRTLHRVRGNPKTILLQSVDQPVPDQDIHDLNIDLVVESPVNPVTLIVGLASIANVDEAVLLEKFKRLQASGALGVPEEFQLAGEDETAIRETPRFAFRDQGSSHQAGPKLNIKPEENPSVFTVDKTHENAVSVPELRAQSLTGAQTEGEASGMTAGDHAIPPMPIGGSEITPIPKSAIELTPEAMEKRKQRYNQFIAKNAPVDPEAHFERDRIMQFNKMIRSAQPIADINEIESDRKEFVKKLFIREKSKKI